MQFHFPRTIPDKHVELSSVCVFYLHRLCTRSWVFQKKHPQMINFEKNTWKLFRRSFMIWSDPWFCCCWGCLRSTPHPGFQSPFPAMTFLVGNPNLNLQFVTVIGWGVRSKGCLHFFPPGEVNFMALLRGSAAPRRPGHATPWLSAPTPVARRRWGRFFFFGEFRVGRWRIP